MAGKSAQIRYTVEMPAESASRPSSAAPTHSSALRTLKTTKRTAPMRVAPASGGATHRDALTRLALRRAALPEAASPGLGCGLALGAGKWGATEFGNVR